MWISGITPIDSKPMKTGSARAMEAIKVISGIGEPLAGELLVFNLGEMRFHKMKLGAS